MTASPLATPPLWDFIAAAYEAEVAPQLERFAERALALAHAPRGSRVADIACGPGTLALRAAREGWVVDALDFSPEMIQRLERRARELRLGGITATVGDGQALPYPSGTCAAAFSLFGLMFFPDRARGFAELRRILAPGGRAVISSWQPIERVPALAAMMRALQDALPAPPGGPPMGEPPLSTPEACREEMSRSFAEVEVHPASISVEYPSAGALWESMERSMPPVVMMRRRLGEGAWAPWARAGRSAVERALGEGAVTLEMHALLTLGVARSPSGQRSEADRRSGDRSE